MSSKIAVVTGAGGGMGGAITARLVEDKFHVVALDINAANLEILKDKFSTNVTTFTVDLTSADKIAEVFMMIKAKFGGVDALVNNAGDCFMSEFPNIPAAEFDKQMAVNFSSAFHCSQESVKLMLERPGIKKIVNISSNGAYNFDVFDPPHYRASKAAMDTLTKDLARRYASEGICVNSIAPAMTESPLFKVLSDEILKKAISQMPRGAAMKPDEIAAWVGFLISSAGDVSSGNVIILNQGRDVR
ncbi:FabG Dehydrogenases with different specificities (related to short-chain alcohol dehydrogenases) [actinobacterium SCGC AAA044-D11]|jgi:NAD(P)-dependent dehydrogenase (short-subunit alcohol dehydrogenase family)